MLGGGVVIFTMEKEREGADSRNLGWSLGYCLTHPCADLHDLFLSFSFCSLKILFIFRERGREGERGRERSMCKRNISWLALSCPQTRKPGPQPRPVP